mmetsp:Transcript_105588/g.192033  ORF Transcript_105588/g.192033 Transcript_105588/m.192033 type:complete len:213 (-) Transcript_105588:5-643(-)
MPQPFSWPWVPSSWQSQLGHSAERRKRPCPSHRPLLRSSLLRQPPSPRHLRRQPPLSVCSLQRCRSSRLQKSGRPAPKSWSALRERLLTWRPSCAAQSKATSRWSWQSPIGFLAFAILGLRAACRARKTSRPKASSSRRAFRVASPGCRLLTKKRPAGSTQHCLRLMTKGHRNGPDVEPEEWRLWIQHPPASTQCKVRSAHRKQKARAHPFT